MFESAPPGRTPGAAPPALPNPAAFALAVYPTIRFYDGRSANRFRLQELPDPITQVTWSG
ncbi:MAG TPA: hypothetical protein PLM79_16955 [Syntrophobacteraceae bacterium]|nr:hypothetical protein [Syntrophobacteraceae bacterium]